MGERERIVGRVGELRAEAVKKRGIVEAFGKIAEKSADLDRKYHDKDVTKHVWYHALAGSTPPDHADILEDFPGEDSVEKFLEDLAT